MPLIQFWWSVTGFPSLIVVNDKRPPPTKFAKLLHPIFGDLLWFNIAYHVRFELQSVDNRAIKAI